MLDLSPLSAAELAATSQPEPKKPTAVLPAPKDAPPLKLDNAAALYAYKVNGHVFCYQAKFVKADGTKRFCPYTWQYNGQNGSWQPGGLAGIANRPLYNHDLLQAKPHKPVLFVEGEKDVEAAAILFPDYVGTTTLNGSKSPHLSNFDLLKDRDVLLSADHDDSGYDYLDFVGRRLQEIGARSVQVLDITMLGRWCVEHNQWQRRDTVPNKYDIADAVAEGWRPQLLQEQINMGAIYPFISRAELREGQTDLPTYYTITPHGVYNDENKRVCSYLRIKARCHYHDTDSWGYLLEYTDPNGVLKSQIIPAKLLSDRIKIRAFLVEKGISFSLHSNKIVDYIQQSGSYQKRRLTILNKAGLHYLEDQPVYVLNSRCFGELHKNICLDPTLKAEAFQPKGTLADWQQHLGRLLKGNPILTLAACAALTAPVAGLLNHESFMLHFFSDSSKGKTTLLNFAKSITGQTIQSWRITDNSAEAVAAAHNNNLLLLDELSQCDPKAAADMVYMLCNGRGKSRMTKDISQRAVLTFQNITLSNGEVVLAQALQQIGRQQLAGQATRMLNIPTNAPFGIYHQLHGFKTAAELSDTIKRDYATHYSGTPLAAFLERLMADVAGAKTRVRAWQQEWFKAYLPEDADGQVCRVANHFALMAAVGALAAEWELYPLEPAEVLTSCGVMFEGWRRTRGGDDAQELLDALQRLKDFMATQACRFQDKTNGLVPRDRAGYVDGDNYYMNNTTFKSEICHGKGHVAIARWLLEKSVFVSGDGKTPTTVYRPTGQKSQRFYQIDMVGLEDL